MTNRNRCVHRRPLHSKRRVWALAALTLGLRMYAGGAAASLPAALETVDADILAARESLAAQRERIASDRAVLTDRLETLQDEVRKLRARVDAAAAEQRRLADTAAETERRVNAIDAELRGVVALLSEFRRAVETHLDAARLQRDRDRIRRIDAALEQDGEEGAGLSALPLVLNWADGLVTADGVSRPFAGEALDARGVLHAGRFLRAGPLTVFVDDAGEVAGEVMTDPSGVEPMLVATAAARAGQAFRAWSAGTPTRAPLDPSGGALFKLLDARVSWVERLRQGGVVMIPLLLIGIGALGIALMRFVALRRMDLDVNPVLTRLLRCMDAGDDDAARRVAEQVRAPWRDVLVDALDHWRADRAYLEEILQDRIAMQGPYVTQYLAALSICAAAAPLLGLLGTVTGMIHTFQLITVFGTGDARTLSGGISEALITTQFGLVIAVPALLAHAYLARKAKAIVAGLEQAAILLIRHGETLTP